MDTNSGKKGRKLMKKKACIIIYLQLCSLFFYAQSQKELKRIANSYYETLSQYSNEVWKSGRSSVLIETGYDKTHYEIFNIFDDDITTAWVEGASNDGVGEYFFAPVKLYGFETNYFYNRKIKNQEIELEININNGFCKSKTTYNNNNRVKKARIYVYDIPLIDAQIGTYVKDDTVPLEIGVYEINLEDTMTLQTFFHKVTLKNTSKEGHVGLFLKFEILEVYKGKKYSDTCISEFAAYATLSN